MQKIFSRGSGKFLKESEKCLVGAFRGNFKKRNIKHLRKSLWKCLRKRFEGTTECVCGGVWDFCYKDFVLLKRIYI
jgi:hypothetical protein